MTLRTNTRDFQNRFGGYNALNDTWQKAGELPQNHVTTQVAKWGDDYIIASGEIRPRVRTPKIWKVTSLPTASSFGALNWITLIAYLGGLIGSRVRLRPKDPIHGRLLCRRSFHSLVGCRYQYFRYGLECHHLPCSSGSGFCHQLGSNSAQRRHCSGGPFIAYMYIPKLRRLNAVTAYQLLEDRFDLGTEAFRQRLLHSFSTLSHGHRHIPAGPRLIGRHGIQSDLLHHIDGHHQYRLYGIRRD